MNPDGWWLPGQHYLKSLSTRQLHRIVVEVGIAAGNRSNLDHQRIGDTRCRHHDRHQRGTRCRRPPFFPHLRWLSAAEGLDPRPGWRYIAASYATGLVLLALGTLVAAPLLLPLNGARAYRRGAAGATTTI